MSALPSDGRIERSPFSEVEARAWAHHGTSEFVGFGTVEISVARGPSGRTSYLQFRLKGVRIPRQAAKQHVEKYHRDDAVVRATIGRDK